MPVIGGGEPNIWPGEKKLPAAQGGAGYAHLMRLGTRVALKIALQELVQSQER